jgi:hypothetical protein
VTAPEGRLQSWEPVYSTDSEPAAYMVAGRLENEGITARVHKEPAGSAFGIAVGILGKVDVLVRTEDFERAIAVLEDEDYEAEADLEEDEYPDEDDE